MVITIKNYTNLFMILFDSHINNVKLLTSMNLNCILGNLWALILLKNQGTIISCNNYRDMNDGLCHKWPNTLLQNKSVCIAITFGVGSGFFLYVEVKINESIWIHLNFQNEHFAQTECTGDRASTWIGLLKLIVW